MGLAKNVIPKFTCLLILNLFLFPSSRATQIQIHNRCSYTVWAAANPGGGKQLNQGETWTLTNLAGSGRIWGRTNCNFGSEGRGKCESGDCDGRLECKVKGRAPNTVAEYALNHGGNDLINISVVEGFNIPMEFSQDQGSCRGASKCSAGVNEACPMELRDPGGCNNPCTVFNNNQFCCNSDNNICEPTSYSKFFKDLCPYASTYPSDGQRSVCPTGTDYKLVFCPSDNDTAPNTAFFEIENNCSYTVWAAAVPGGGKRLDPKQKWPLAIDMASLKTGGRIWGRTNCSFDDGRRGNCESGDCGGVLECKGNGQAPNTLAEYTLTGVNTLDFFDISLVDGFNIPMEFGPAKSESLCGKGVSCAHDINVDCPNELRAPGGCNNACSVYKTDQYCCTGANATPTACGPTVFSLFFKDRCPDAYSYVYDDATATFVCPGGNSYQVVFCP